MTVQSIKLVCFSPTGTSKAVVKGIARGMNQIDSELIDITSPDARKQHLNTSENELLIVAVPVYMGRVPALLHEWLNALEAGNTPAVCVVVYGNRLYENALLELKETLTKRGCKPIACASFIGEHSFSSFETPTAAGRPDTSDLKLAENFGRKIYEKLDTLSTQNHFSIVEVPGSHPYGEVTELWDVDFIAVGEECIQCGICADVCPVGAVDPEESNMIDIERCITCCACIKNCPQDARSMKSGPVKDAAIRLNKLYNERKEPEFFF